MTKVILNYAISTTAYAILSNSERNLSEHWDE